ncbi:MAG: hypothetical protein CML99_07195 [Rhodobiaceae bacterium]|nr:hypothetical protein [Rhodobiaceae bacterium]
MNAQKSKKAIIYCRVSSAEQVDGTSLSMQQQACEAYCEKLGLRVARVFVEKGESAKTAQRTEFIKAIDYCKMKQHAIGHFVVWKIDRFARNTSDHFSVKSILTKHGVSIRSVTEVITEDPQGLLMETILAGFSQFDNDIRAMRTRNGMRERLRQGVWVWNTPFGYQRTQKGANLSINPKTAPTIKLIFETYATGMYTYEEVAEKIHALGHQTAKGKKPCAQQIDRIVKNPIYCGLFRVWGEEHKAAFTPIIDEHLFNQCQDGYQERMKNATRIPKNPNFPLRRLVSCTACSQPLTASTSTGRHGKKYSYYHHQKQDCDKASFVATSDMEEKFVAYLQRISPTLAFENAFKAVVTDIWKNNTKVLVEAQRREQREKAALEDERQRIFEAHRAGVYSNEEFLEQKDVINRRLSRLPVAKGSRTSDKSFDIEAALDHFFDLMRDAAATWQRMDFSEKLRFQKLLFGNGNVPFDGETFGTADLSPIFALSEGYAGDKSALVTQVGAGWKQVVSNLVDNKFIQQLVEW